MLRKEAEENVEEARDMAKKVIDHLDIEHITSLSNLEDLLKSFLVEIKNLKIIKS